MVKISNITYTFIYILRYSYFKSNYSDGAQVRAHFTDAFARTPSVIPSQHGLNSTDLRNSVDPTVNIAKVVVVSPRQDRPDSERQIGQFNRYP